MNYINYSQIESYDDYLTQLQLDYITECSNILKSIDKLVSHLPRVTSIATGVGHCIYEAKLKEFLGIKGIISSNFPGKGKLVHKLLALASLEVFGRKQSQNKIYDIFNELVEELGDEAVKEKDTAIEIFNSLLAVKDKLFEAVGINPDNVIPIVEQQIYDYDLHMLGVPDLILEDQKNRAAVVIEWKSYPDTLAQGKSKSLKNISISNYEKVQVIAYAMLEARRLGYEVQVNSYNKISLFDAISGVLINNKISNVKILPVIIRPGLGTNKRLSLPPHPIFSNRGNIEDNYNKFKQLMGEILVTSHYLTYLLTDFYLYGYSKEDLEQCSKNVNGKSRIAFLWAPPYPIPRGKPSDQSNSRLCQFCNVRDECKFYIGERHINYFQKIVWLLRYSSLSEKEKIMWPFRAVYELLRFYSRNKIVEYINRGVEFCWDGNAIRANKGGSKNTIQIEMKGKRTRFKVDVVNIIQYDEKEDTLVAERKVRDFEYSYPRILYKGTPIVLFLNDNASRLPLSINMTGTVQNVDFVKSDNKIAKVKYEIGIPSPALGFQFHIIRKYLNIYPELFKNVIVVQTGVDLTHIDLLTLDVLQRVIGNKIENLQNSENKEKLKKIYDDVRKKYEDLVIESEMDPELVSESILRLFTDSE
jgi:hypothetical protein